MLNPSFQEAARAQNGPGFDPNQNRTVHSYSKFREAAGYSVQYCRYFNFRNCKLHLLNPISISVLAICEYNIHYNYYTVLYNVMYMYFTRTLILSLLSCLSHQMVSRPINQIF